jgi:hypothetical protein
MPSSFRSVCGRIRNCRRPLTSNLMLSGVFYTNRKAVLDTHLDYGSYRIPVLEVDFTVDVISRLSMLSPGKYLVPQLVLPELCVSLIVTLACLSSTNVTEWDYRLYTRLSVCLSVHNVSGLFSTMCAAVALKHCAWLYIYDLQITFEDRCYWSIFGRVMPLDLSHFKGFYSFVILSCRSNSSLVLIHYIFTKLWPLNKEKYLELSVFFTFVLSAYRYSFNIW